MISPSWRGRWKYIIIINILVSFAGNRNCWSSWTWQKFQKPGSQTLYPPQVQQAPLGGSPVLTLSWPRETTASLTAGGATAGPETLAPEEPSPTRSRRRDSVQKKVLWSAAATLTETVEERDWGLGDSWWNFLGWQPRRRRQMRTLVSGGRSCWRRCGWNGNGWMPGSSSSWSHVT